MFAFGHPGVILLGAALLLVTGVIWWGVYQPESGRVHLDAPIHHRRFTVFPDAPYGTDMHAYLNKTKQLVRQRHYQEALKRHVWFHEHAIEHDPGMSGVRLSFALSAWRDLAEVYPPAKKALVDTRDRKTLQIKQGARQPGVVPGCGRTEPNLGRECQNRAALSGTRQDQWPRSPAGAGTMQEHAVQGKQYDLLGKYIKDLLKEYDRVKAMYDMNVGLSSDSRLGGPRFRSGTKTTSSRSVSTSSSWQPSAAIRRQRKRFAGARKASSSIR